MNEAKALGLLREKIRLKHMEYSTEKSYSSWLKKYMGFVRTLPAHVEPISYQEYDGDIQRERFGRQELGIGATMFFNARIGSSASSNRTKFRLSAVRWTIPRARPIRSMAVATPIPCASATTCCISGFCCLSGTRFGASASW